MIQALRAAAANDTAPAGQQQTDFYALLERSASFSLAEKLKFLMSLALPVLIEFLSPVALCAAIALRKNKEK